ncbi:MAG: hydrolase, partial [Rhodothermales bacterium]
MTHPRALPKLLGGACLTLIMAEPVFSQSTDRPDVQAVTLSAAPTLDGLIEGDPAWDHVPFAHGFTQTTPFDGQPASFDTRVRVGVHGSMLYIGAVLLDPDPSELIVSDRRRDASLGDSDSFRFILDTFADQQNGFVFGTNVAGAEYDAQLIGSSGGTGFGSRMSGGSGGGLNVNWDAAWDV